MRFVRFISLVPSDRSALTAYAAYLAGDLTASPVVRRITAAAAPGSYASRMDERPTPADDIVRPLLRVHQSREFTSAPVDSDALEAVADAARWSGSAANAQPWRFILIRDADTLRRVAEAALPHTRSLTTATAAIAIASLQEQGRAVGHAFDEGRAAERILIAASLLGLGAGIAWIPAETRPLVGDMLGIPEDRFVRTIVAIGHPGESARRPRPRGARLPRAETVFHERYGAS
jgi:nitroreductase